MTSDKLAVLIDADNAQASIIQELLSEVSRYGTASVKRIYGDWTTDKLKAWKSVLNKMAIQPIQQFAYTNGKNSTDSALIIDAMDLLHDGNLNGFCLVSSDSDFTRLATRIREAGLVVYGFGEKKTPQPFVAACDKFIYTEILRTLQDTVPGTSPTEPNSMFPERPCKGPTEDPDAGGDGLEKKLSAAVSACALDNGWTTLAQVGSMLLKNDSSFDPRNYGFPKLGELVRKQHYLEVKEIQSAKGSPIGHLHVRLKARPSTDKKSQGRTTA